MMKLKTSNLISVFDDVLLQVSSNSKDTMFPFLSLVGTFKSRTTHAAELYLPILYTAHHNRKTLSIFQWDKSPLYVISDHI